MANQHESGDHTVQCENCGAIASDQASYCANCGSSLKGSDTTQTAGRLAVNGRVLAYDWKTTSGVISGDDTPSVRATGLLTARRSWE